MKRRLRPINYDQLARTFGSYLHRPSYPFNHSDKNIIVIERHKLEAFFWFLKNQKNIGFYTPWQSIDYDPRGKSIEQFHHTLFCEILERTKKMKGRLRLCVIIRSYDAFSIEIQQLYRKFQRTYCYPGFKMSVVLKKPKDFIHHKFPSNCNGIGFGDLLFVCLYHPTPFNN